MESLPPSPDFEHQMRLLRKRDPGRFLTLYLNLFGSFASVAGSKSFQNLYRQIASLRATKLPIDMRLEARGPALQAKLSSKDVDAWFHIESKSDYSQVSTFHNKEAETQEWIASFERGEVFFDIGANIGLFSIYAAAQPVKAHTVVAFEPSFNSLNSLCWTIHHNNLSDHVIPLNVGLSDKTGLDTFNFKRMESGTAKSVVGAPVDFRNRQFVPAATQNILVFALDDAIDHLGLPIPHHIKIDVDGIEMKVVSGAKRTLSNPRVRSIMVEAADEGMESALVREFDPLGFKLTKQQKKILDQSNTRNNYFSRA